MGYSRGSVRSYHQKNILKLKRLETYRRGFGTRAVTISIHSTTAALFSCLCGYRMST